MKWRIIEEGGSRHRIALARVGGGTWLSWRGGSCFVVPEERGAREKAKDDAIRAPMTAKVIEVKVALGDLVENGDEVLVLEAMKMEYRLKALKGGRVERIACQIEDLVDLGQELVVLGEA
ncbi:MAG: acetyl-CoA carboxylase biotin carboxyl carrier protein subunit [Myxococcota bacterium]|nr:acetyl-CoA carboxylase biotin carboxyl carrier protein subunit [Myxococcota bacterium]